MQANFKIVNQDALSYPSNVLVTCCNCFHTWGKGIARQIKLRYPEAYEADLKTVKGSMGKLGGFSYAKVENESKDTPEYIFNLYGQYHYDSTVRQLDYEAFYKGLEGLKEFCSEVFAKEVSFPYMIGCGLAGGNWNIVSTMIEEVFSPSTRILGTYCKI